MNRFPVYRKLGIVSLLWLLCASSIAFGQPPKDAKEPKEAKEKTEAVLPKLRDMPVPPLEDLLTGKQVDWIVLHNLDVIVVEPVTPRPHTLEKMQAAIEASAKWPKPRTPEELEDQKARKKQLPMLQVTVIGDDVDPDFQIHIRHIEKIVYAEDHLLARINELLDEKKFGPAYAAIAALERRQPRWPKADLAQNRLLFLEAESAKNPETALVFCEELHERDASFPKLAEMMGQVAEGLANSAIEQQDFRRARHFLQRLATCYPQHATVKQLRGQLIELANTAVIAARESASTSDWRTAVGHVERAARIWPVDAKVKAAHKEICERYPVLQVGVLSFPGEAAGYPFEDAPAWRHRTLTTIPLFSPTRIEADLTAYRSPVIDNWEPTDLGRQVRLTLRSTRAEFESRPMVSAPQIADQLSRRLRPNQLEYDDRLAGFMQSIAVASPFELDFSLRRVPYRMESLLRFALEENDGFRELRFRQVDRNAQQVRFQRVVPQTQGIGGWRIAEIVETRFENWERSLQALNRGEVSLLPDVSPRDLTALKNDSRFQVHPYVLPASHVLVVSPKSDALKRGELRRALVAGINRQRLMTELYLGENAADVARLTSTVLPSSFAVVPRDLPELRFQPGLSASLAATAKKNLGGELPSLKLACPADARIRSVVTAMIADWEKLGIRVEIVDPPKPGKPPIEQFDLAYRTVRIEEPISDFWPLLTWEPNANIAALSNLPSWLRNRLLALDQVSEWESAVKQLAELQHNLLADARYIPLWEVDEFWVARKRFAQIPPRLLHPYQNADRWLQSAWYPQENP